ncbi:hypothetical protein SMGD1_1120 [Sulfurimonas gotlandica GD1]|uniref:Uncharacterized protein n=1 Tax=Sulfurimonas gotlandica (strain DSM 19862 / JCM 16533 / GD1) TaxID=929558 RepID=B6BGL6_SULGG|nr:hypothetical protein [Sulfurimonas gotlandica]EDZ63358.1 hypothetical protein CBGD1_978 [Sulfurimonas gotlandica GD1]EHP29644.1 hypothetical protein SMGD1_1120 [Sulfurimonas gotlandica GD1]
MNVTSYTFQSPYPNAVQVGRPDPSSKQESSAPDTGTEIIKGTNTSLAKAESFQATQIQEVKPTVDSGSTIDVYA